MQRLSTLDAAFLHAEDADPHTKLGIGGLAILDGPIPDHTALMSTLGERIAVCPRFAQRLRRRTFDLSAPEWVDDDRFKLAHHVHRVAVPAPGSDEDLFRLIADVMSWRLDRSRPLWEIWIIDGLAGNRWALLMKVHPSLADGIATVHILTGLSDSGMSDGATGCHGAATASEPAAQRLRPAPPADTSSDWQRMLHGPAEIATGAVAVALRALQALRSSGELAAGLLRPVSSLNGPITARRRYSAARVALDDVNQICRTFDVTANDVALAALTASYREMLLRRGESPQAESLRTLMPVSLPAPDGQHPTQTDQAMLLPYLPVEEDNPVLRLRMVHVRLAKLKAAVGDQASTVAATALGMLPFPVTAWAMDLLSRLPQRNVVTLAVNVPGPRHPLQIMGCNVVRVLPIPPIGIQLRTATAVLNYADELFFGILADFDTVPDVDELAHGVETAVARLLARSKRRRTAGDRRGLSLVVSA
ncbi:MAG TPA: wax ester/triacylglycerol synthase family O-acyltransferase [Mycobacterium sp.]|nr:wax ester/triacylglycerol synthase family O-acyltransferase [Mycobacterium sp.]